MAFVDYQRRGKVAIITLNRPERMNAFGSDLARGVAECAALFKEDGEALVAIITGAGRAFCAGLDVKEVREKGTVFTTEPTRLLYPYGSLDLLKPIIAAVNGYCLGAGMNFVLMGADIRIAARSAVFGLPEVARGIMVCQIPFAPWNIPTTALMEMSLLGENITAQRAYELGIVSRVVPDEQLMPAALEMAEKIARQSPQAVMHSKWSLLKLMEASEAGKTLEGLLFKQSATSADALEGSRSFLEKREPHWAPPPH